MLWFCVLLWFVSCILTHIIQGYLSVILLKYIKQWFGWRFHPLLYYVQIKYFSLDLQSCDNLVELFFNVSAIFMKLYYVRQQALKTYQIFGIRFCICNCLTGTLLVSANLISQQLLSNGNRTFQNWHMLPQVMVTGMHFVTMTKLMLSNL